MRKIDLGGGRVMSVAEPKENVAAADAAVAEILGIAVDAIKAQRKALASYDNHSVTPCRGIWRLDTGLGNDPKG